MEPTTLQEIAFSLAARDALHLIGAGAALLAGLVFIDLGRMLPGLRSSLDGGPADPRGGYGEFGPRAEPIISEQNHARASAAKAEPDPYPRARPHLWRYLSGCGGAEFWPHQGKGIY